MLDIIIHDPVAMFISFILVAGALWLISVKLYDAAQRYSCAQSSKASAANSAMLKARYESLGVNCYGNCYLFGCKYERITDELHGLGIEQDVIERLVESLNGVEHRKPCACGQALLPLLVTKPEPTPTPQQELPCVTS